MASATFDDAATPRLTMLTSDSLLPSLRATRQFAEEWLVPAVALAFEDEVFHS